MLKNVLFVCIWMSKWMLLSAFKHEGEGLKLIKNCKKVNNIWKMKKWKMMCVLHVSSIWITESKPFSEKSVQRVLSLKFVTHLLADWPNLIFHIHDDCCWPEVLVCHFWDVCCRSKTYTVPFYKRTRLSLRRRNGAHVWGRIFGWQPFLSMVSINFFAVYLRKQYFSQIYRFQVLPRALVGFGLRFVSNFGTNLIALVTEWNVRWKPLQEPYKTLKFVAVIFTRVKLSSRKWPCHNLSCMSLRVLVSNSSLGCEFFYSSFSFSFQFPHLGLFLTHSVLSVLFSGFVSKTGGYQNDSSREDEDQVKNIIASRIWLNWDLFDKKWQSGN